MDLLNMYYAWGENFSGYTINAWMVNHLEVPVLVTIAYLFMVLYIPDNFMKQREAMSLRWLNILWNFILSAFSFVGAYYCIPELYHLIMHRQGSFNIYHGLCIWDAHGYWEGYSGAFVALFILSKIPEMIDTVFLVFQKKKIIFLHWYHHVTVMLYCWHAYSNRISSGLVFAAMNYGVHSIMYTYYFMCACGQRKLVRPFAPLITFLQIAQMVVGMIVEAYCLYHHYISQKGCATSATNARLGLMMYVSYFILFCQLFKQSYLSPKPARAVEAAKAGTDKPEKKKRA